MIERHFPPGQADEKEMLVSFLDFYRATLLLKTEGLSDDDARSASVPPSDLSLMGLIRHMAEVERSWFQRWFMDGGPPRIYEDDDDRDRDLHPGATDVLADAVATWRQEVERSRQITSTAQVEDLALRIGEPEWPTFQPSLRWILIHMIEEYARHCGHADLIRQRIDGAVGD